MILVDANVLMYAAGAEHPNKAASVALLEAVAADRLDAALDAEVLQEVLHRYRAIGRWDDGRLLYDRARLIFGVVLPIEAEAVDTARRLLDEHRDLGARDALHAAVVECFGLEALCTYDRGFDRLAGIRRAEPEELVG